MSDCLAFNEWPSVLQDAAQRRSRKPPHTAKSGTRYATRERSTAPQNHPNNYIAEAAAMRRAGQTSPIGGRNRKGAGAPMRNRNAHGERALRFHIQLKKRLLADHLQLLVLAAAVVHLEQTARPGARLAEQPKNFVKQLSCRSASYAPPRHHHAEERAMA